MIPELGHMINSQVSCTKFHHSLSPEKSQRSPEAGGSISLDTPLGAGARELALGIRLMLGLIKC